MKLTLEWERPIRLTDGRGDGLIYTIDVDKVLDTPGVYVFARRWGSSLEALYVGHGSNVRSRIKGQMNNVRLMQHLVNAKTGRRIVLFGRARP